MTFTAAMRIGSVEIVAALAAFGAVAGALRPGTKWLAAREMRLGLLVRPTANGSVRDAELRVGEGMPVIIGRAPETQLQVNDPEVSRRHARLELVRGVLYLTDLGSSNGTFLNGKPLHDESIELRAGDSVDLGTSRITVREAVMSAWK